MLHRDRQSSGNQNYLHMYTLLNIPFWVYYTLHDIQRPMNISSYDISYLQLRSILKELRETRHLTQARLAKKLGAPQSFVSKYETGERRLDIIETILICQALETSAPQLLAELSNRLAKTTIPIAKRKRQSHG